MKCPKCGRDTYSKKWDSCAACGLGSVTSAVTPTKQKVTQTITQERPVLVPVTESVTPGEECPTCGQKVPMTNAQRQAAYRGRKA
jgi:rRNA maturation endonuclease Nob1